MHKIRVKRGIDGLFTRTRARYRKRFCRGGRDYKA